MAVCPRPTTINWGLAIMNELMGPRLKACDCTHLLPIESYRKGGLKAARIGACCAEKPQRLSSIFWYLVI